MSYSSSKKPGNILSAFQPEKEVILDHKYKILKNELFQPFSKEIKAGWERLISSFTEETKLIKKLSSDVIPQIEFSKICKSNGQFPSDVADEIRKRGCVVVRNVVDSAVALEYKSNVKSYIEKHLGKIAGFPENDPQVWELYWSKPQVAARSHPNFVQVTKAVNQLWHAKPGTPIDFSLNLTYCDRLRIRKPKDTSFALGEHIDGGSVERWEDPEYRKCYTNILKGEWEKHDAFDATNRIQANMDLYNCSGGCSMFRTFQGWMSLSNVKPGGGTLRLCPLIKHTTAYVILRPFLRDLINSTDMGGAIPGVQQHILQKLHPHIVDAMVSIPEVNPGDCVFWHCDCVHAVEGICNSPDDSSVLYIPSTPLCSKNAEYLTKQRYAFEKGLTPQDFPLNDCEVDFEDRANPKDLTDLGKLGMGFVKFECNQDPSNHDGAHQAIQQTNQILFKV